MPGTFVVVGESVAIMTDLHGCLIEMDERQRSQARWRRARRSRPTSTEDRTERILREHVLDVGDEQFLMLLLVMKPENQNWLDFIDKVFVGIGKQIVHVRVDRRAIALCFLHRRARD